MDKEAPSKASANVPPIPAPPDNRKRRTPWMNREDRVGSGPIKSGRRKASRKDARWTIGCAPTGSSGREPVDRTSAAGACWWSFRRNAVA